MKSALFKMTAEELNFSITCLLLILDRFFNPFDWSSRSLIIEFLLAAMTPDTFMCEFLCTEAS